VTLGKRAGRDYSKSRICIILHILPVSGIWPNYCILNSLFTIAAETPPMPPPWLGHGQVEVEVAVEVELLRDEHRAEQRREQLLEQPWEQVKVEVKVEVEVQVEIEVEVEVEMKRKAQLMMQASTQPVVLLPALPNEQRGVLHGTQSAESRTSKARIGRLVGRAKVIQH
jgi:hypothetical protein